MISLRMTEEQYDKMMELMQIDGYHSRSRFIINTVLSQIKMPQPKRNHGPTIPFLLCKCRAKRKEKSVTTSF